MQGERWALGVLDTGQPHQTKNRANESLPPQELIWCSSISACKRYKISHLNCQGKLQSGPKLGVSLTMTKIDQTFNSILCYVSKKSVLNSSWIFHCVKGHIFGSISTFTISHYYSSQWISCTSNLETSQILLLLSMFCKYQIKRQLL